MIWFAPDVSAWAQLQIDIGGGGGVKEDRKPNQTQRKHEEPSDREHKRGKSGLGVQLNIGEGPIRPSYCYTYEIKQVVTCKKRSLNGETCAGKCILSGDSTEIGEAPPSHLKVDGVSYRCQCRD